MNSCGETVLTVGCDPRMVGEIAIMLMEAKRGICVWCVCQPGMAKATLPLSKPRTKKRSLRLFNSSTAGL